MYEEDNARAVADDQDHRRRAVEARRIERLRQVTRDARYSDKIRLAALSKLRAAIVERERLNQERG